MTSRRSKSQRPRDDNLHLVEEIAVKVRLLISSEDRLFALMAVRRVLREIERQVPEPRFHPPVVPQVWRADVPDEDS